MQLLSHVWLSCDPLNCSAPGFPLLHYLPYLLKLMSIELVMLFNHRNICCSILFLPSFFSRIRVFSNELAPRFRKEYWSSEVLELQLQYWEWIFRVDFLQDCLVWSPCCPRDSSRVSSSTRAWKHQFFDAQPSLWSNFHIHAWLLEKP